MKWLHKDNHYVESTCENYRVTKALIQGEERYLSWIKNGKEWETAGEVSTNFKEAITRYRGQA